MELKGMRGGGFDFKDHMSAMAIYRHANYHDDCL